MGDSFTNRLACTQWHARDSWRYEGDFNATTAHPILLLGNVVDPVTPLRNAYKMSKGFRGSVVLASDIVGHTSLNGVSLCTSKAVRDYFQTGELPEADTVCTPDRLPMGRCSVQALPDGETDEALWRAMVEMATGGSDQSEMASFLTNLGLTANNTLAPLPNYGPYFLLGNFLFSYVVTTTRFQKTSYGCDNNINPRYDLESPRAEQLVSKGKLTNEQLEQLRRIQSAHSNSMEHYTVFVAAIMSAMIAKLDGGVVNRYATIYTLVRAAYFWVYRQNTTRQAAGFRSVLWWASNIVCIRLFWFAGKALNKNVL
ncbi:hypothetical protein D6D25_03115 [Aureobasidium pullulans]|nr:hypothetical protein D6D25_03115 [Aureobasidium pullulans]